MLHCNRCGQNKNISEDNFIAYRHISGSETVYVSCEDANEIVDYGDSDTDSDGIEDYECPHCHSQNINIDWEDDDENIAAALILREEWKKVQLEHERRRKNEKTKNEKWDE